MKNAEKTDSIILAENHLIVLLSHCIENEVLELKKNKTELKSLNSQAITKPKNLVARSLYPKKVKTSNHPTKCQL